MRKRYLAALAAMALPGLAWAQADNATLFGTRESVEQIALSPNGDRLVVIQPAPTGQGAAVYVVDLATGKPVRLTGIDGDPERLAWCRWVSNDRLLCSIYAVTEIDAIPIAMARLIAFNADGSEAKMVSTRANDRALGIDQGGGSVLDWLPEENGAVLKTRRFIPEKETGTRLANTSSGLAVEWIDTTTLKTKTIELPKRDAVEYISDGHGKIRILGLRPPQGPDGYAGHVVNYMYRTKDSNEWQPLSKVQVNRGDQFDPYAVDRDLNIVYGFARKNGRRGLYSISLDGAVTEKLIFEHPEVDAGDVVRVGRRNRVVGVTYTTEKKQVQFFDPELNRLRTALGKAIPGLPLVNFVDSSLDESKLLLWAGSDVDPGRYFLFDKKTKHLNEALLSRPLLEKVVLPSMKPISYKTADGVMVPGYLTLPPGSDGKNLPGIVMPHGGPGSRDVWGFDWLAQYFAMQGFAVLQPNFRGSAGYGDEWYQKNGFQSWRLAIGDVNDGARWLIKEGIADSGKMAIFGWSYGGYAALQAAAVEPDLYKASIAVAPVTDLEALKSDAYKYTSYLVEKDFIGTGPHIREGSPAQNAEKIKAPVLMFHGDKDLNVTVRQSRLMADRLKDAGKVHELVIYPKLDHYLEDTTARIDMLKKSDAFLRAAMKLPAK
jgi:dipeptidyl aminopeptidase/acylaminoacyl peptidase